MSKQLGSFQVILSVGSAMFGAGRAGRAKRLMEFYERYNTMIANQQLASEQRKVEQLTADNAVEKSKNDLDLVKLEIDGWDTVLADMRGSAMASKVAVIGVAAVVAAGGYILLRRKKS